MKSGIDINFNKLWAIHSEHDARYNTNTVKVEWKMEQKTWNIAKNKIRTWEMTENKIENSKIQNLQLLLLFLLLLVTLSPSHGPPDRPSTNKHNNQTGRQDLRRRAWRTEDVTEGA